tara:strand:- start:224 stop:2347 length:2124 start_codon:yes stop_codon:yes gene_type:complete
MGVLDFIFGNRDDNLEGAESVAEPDPAPKTNHLENIYAWDRPLYSSADDRVVGMSELDGLIYETMAGTQYTVGVNPDQRNPHEKIVDGAKAIGTAAVNYAKDPFLPSKEAVGQFAYDATIGASESLGDIMFKGEGTYGDLLGLALGVGGGAQAVGLTKFAPNVDGSTTGMFLPVMKTQRGPFIAADANVMKREGKSRDEIWQKLGVWQLGDADEWLYEIPDNKAEIALTVDDAPRQTKTVTETQRRRVGGGPTQSEIIAAKTRAQMDMINLRRAVESGEITAPEQASKVAEISARLNQITGGTGTLDYEDVLVTREVPIPKPKLTKGYGVSQASPNREASTLDQVLHHDSLYDELDELGINTNEYPTAEAGRRKDLSAGEDASGVAYPDTEYTRRLFSKFWSNPKGKSMISSFTNAGNWISRPRNARDGVVVAEMVGGKITKDQARAQMILSTMLHETQHWLDSKFKSESGVGFNPVSGADARRAMKQKYDNLKGEAFSLDPGREKTSQLLSDLLATTNTEFVGKVKYLDSSKFAATFEELVYGPKGPAVNTGPKMPNILVRDQGKLEEILDLAFASRLTDTQLDAAGKQKNREMFKTALISNVLDPKGKLPIEQAVEKADLLVRILDSPEGQNLYSAYVQVLTGKTGLIRNLTSDELYYLEMGEAKSRLVQARRDMSKAEREATPPWMMLDRDEFKLWNEQQYGMR